MKNKFFRLLIPAVMMLMMPFMAQAGNSWLWTFDNYQVMSMGDNVLRFTFPVWVYGKGSNSTIYTERHSANNDNMKDTYLWYSEVNGSQRGSADVHRIVSFGADRKHNYDTRCSGCPGYAYALVDAGSIVIRNTYDGVPMTLTPGDRSGWDQWIEVTRQNTSYVNHVVYIQFDWYMPEELQNKDFYIGLNVHTYYASDGDDDRYCWWQWGTKYNGGDIPQSPQLFDPYFYSVAGDGIGSLGMAAMQYMTFHDPISYHTSMQPDLEVSVSERSGPVLVPMQDTVQDHFYADFHVWLNKEAKQSQHLTSNKVLIPAYHKIYDFAASEVRNEQNSVTGDVDIAWKTHYPEEQDIMETDVFEVQRATQEDYSDAQTIGLLPLTNDDSIYQLIDPASDVLALLKKDSLYDRERTRMTVTEYNVESRDDAGFHARFDASLYSDVFAPGVPLYYRVRRASAATWDWNESPYMAATSLIKANYLAPLASEQAAYTLDPDFAENRTVHFRFRLDNAEIENNIPPVDQTSLTIAVDPSSVSGVAVPVRIVHSTALSGYTFTVKQSFNDEVTQIPYSIQGNIMELNAVAGSTITVRVSIGGLNSSISFSVPARGKTVQAYLAYYTNIVKTLQYQKRSEEDNLISEEELSELVRQHVDEAAIKTQLYPQLLAKMQFAEPGGRCMWDRNADLVLVRKIVETGAVNEIRVPKDSILMQEDGSYMAHVTDVANLSCVHYAYEVRIDQTEAVLQVQKTSQLDPVAITGPDLYTNTSADIASFEASDGTDKRGVILTWQPTAGSIDYYVLERRVQGSSEGFDTLAVLDVEGYFDEHDTKHKVVPGQAYEYRLTTHYTCNGFTTKHTATAIGRRSPYGVISGRVQYEDGSGCYGTTVTLSSEGKDDIKIATDESGAFSFDSLLYGVSTTYSIMPTSQTAQFVYNNTSSPTATITLTAENNVAQNLTFNNISAVRLTGRVLYKLSSVPVRDANLLLNGKLVRKSGEAVKTDMSGNFTISVPLQSAFTLQVIKEGHTFEGDGFVRIEGDSMLTLSKALDGVRIWDATKVRLSGRVIGGLDQASLPLGQGLSRNNLGDHIQLVMELEGDNVSYIVRDPDDLTKDTLEYEVGATKVHYQHKRIVIEPDPLTGEYEADLFPTKYKLIQANAQGYATLLAQGKASEVIDLSNTQPGLFSITYRSPIEITYKQSQYGLDYDYYGIKTWTAQTLTGEEVKVDIAEQDSTGQWNYLFGAPVFYAGRYQFRVSAHENYYYNNDRSTKPDIVYLKGGNLKIYNGLRETTDISTAPLDANGSALVSVLFDHVTFVQTGENALHALDFSVESEGEYVNSEPMQAYVLGAVEKATDFMEMDTTETGITLLDILRDPPGSASYAYLEKGTTYRVSYKDTYNYRFGVYLNVSLGNNNQYFVGTYAGTPAGGATAGMMSVVQKTSNWNLPIAIQWHGSSQADYSFTTNERIQTGTGPRLVGSKGDVYIGVTNGVMTSKADAFRIVDSISYEMLKGQIDNRNVLVVQQGTDSNGRPWYLMRTEDVLIKQGITSSFTYTQSHITGTVIPELFYRRNNLLLTGSRDEAVAAAQAANKPVYWSMVHPDSTSFGEEGHYELIKPEGYKSVVIDQVHLCNKAIDNWIGVIATNEAEKVATLSDTPIQTHSINGGITRTYTESYAYSDYRSAYFGMPWENQTGMGMNSTTQLMGDQFLSFSVSSLKYLFGSSTYSMLLKHLRNAKEGVSPSQYVKAEVGTVKLDIDYKPIIETGRNLLPENGETIGSTKTTGYVIAPDLAEHITFSVYKSKTDYFNEAAKETREEAHDLNGDNTNKYLFGSLMYRTLGGATKCPWEGADSTLFYSPGTPLNAATQKIENPQIVINRHEMSNVPHDQAAKFTITMWNEVDETVGIANGLYIPFILRLDENSNPKGAKISIDGMPLADGREFRFSGSTPVTKTLEIRAGDDYDYEDICLILESSCTPVSVYQKLCLSVHYMPVSCNVNISMPSDKWILNTLSPRDDQGYYMPVSIDGFDVNYDNFDHIELQYKLTTQSNEAWVNLCSYYAEDSLYQLASGTKAMIENGKIENYRFYGERDPMEQQYDLRAVSFCRHGSGFITKSSPVLTGIKDTRTPRVFGEPEPANAILGVGDNLKLRFSEAIAGNYLDEDNNFQIIGYTNESGITTGTSLHFDGTDNSYAQSKVLRSFFDKSFSVDMLVRPADPVKGGILFSYYSEDKKSTMVIIMTNNRLTILSTAGTAFSLPFSEPITAFTRVVVAYDREEHKARFFVGTEDITNPNQTPFWDGLRLATSGAPICLGKGFNGNMMEVRLWSKALTAEEVALTHMHRLTGYEKELIAYYPMDEGQGETLSDKATGATLYTYGATWEHQQSISLHIGAEQEVRMDGNLMSRSAKQDETLMFWFKTNVQNGTLFSAGRTDSKHGTDIVFRNGGLYLRNDSSSWPIAGSYADNEWHHFALAVNRTYNNVAVYIDDQLLQTFAATKLSAISGDMLLGGNGFEGNIDEFAIFEQALPKSMLESFGTTSPVGDEMGLMAYLPFSEMKENSNGIYELVFSANDQRIIKVDNQTTHHVTPLLLSVSDGSELESLADKDNCAPVEEMGKLTKMNFDWAFNNDELLINLNMLDREINKRTVYITVRDVEDLNGNPMVSPITWTAYVDKNALKWEERTIRMHAVYGDNTGAVYYTTRIFNYSGKRHQYTIESLPDWLATDKLYGSINPTEELYLTLEANVERAPGVYEDIVYLTDENGLSEPLRVELTIEAVPPYDAPDEGLYPLNMSLCAQVMLEDSVYDTDPNDIIYAFFSNDCIGKEHVSFDDITHTSKVFMTVYGNLAMNRQPVRFQLWQASTGKVFDLHANRNVLFAHGYVYNCGDEQPLILTTSRSETQNIAVKKGWNWIATYMDLKATQGALNVCMTANEPWKNGDVIKNPRARQFSSYDEASGTFVGSLNTLHYSQMYMVYSAAGNTMRIAGDKLSEDSMKIRVRGDGRWSVMPCLIDEKTPLSEALAGYYDNATPGDLIKSHNSFATFSTDKRWEGNLTVMCPGEGYLFRRMGAGSIDIPFYRQSSSEAPKKVISNQSSVFSNPQAATNMTMIARVEGLDISRSRDLEVFVADEKAAVSSPLTIGEETYYFLTIQSDKVGEPLRFEMDGERLETVDISTYRHLEISNIPDSHHGSLKAPIMLRPAEDRPYKIIEHDHVFIIRDGKTYTITGAELR